MWSLLWTYETLWYELQFHPRSIPPTYEIWVNFQKYQVLPTKVKSEALSEKAQHNISISDDGGLSLYINLKEDLPDLYMTINLDMNFDAEKDNDVDVVKRTVNCCQLFNDSSYAKEVQFFYKIFLDHGHFPVKCPVKKVRNLM